MDDILYMFLENVDLSTAMCMQCTLRGRNRRRTEMEIIRS